MSHDTHSLPATRALPAAADTERLGRALAHACRVNATAIMGKGLQVNLRGELGAGKTALVRGWLRGFGIGGPIRSPTFAVLEPYVVSLHQRPAAGRARLEAQQVSSLDFYHFDFYRFADPAEFSVAGFREQFGAGSICAIEWPEKAGDRLPGADLTITLQVAGDGRLATLRAESTLGHGCLDSALEEFDAIAAA